MHKDWDQFETSKFKVGVEKEKVKALIVELEADKAKFEEEKKTEEWSATGWKKKAKAKVALLVEERKHWVEACARDNKEKITLRNEIEKLKQEKADALAAAEEACSHRECSEQKEEQMKEDLEVAKKNLQLAQVEKAELARRLSENEHKVEEAETARATAESIAEPLTNSLTWMQQYSVVNVSVLELIMIKYICVDCKFDPELH